jgi:hypothetical protein
MINKDMLEFSGFPKVAYMIKTIRKTEFRKRKRRVERRWREEKYADVSEAAELDISESNF